MWETGNQPSASTVAPTGFRMLASRAAVVLCLVNALVQVACGNPSRPGAVTPSATHVPTPSPTASPTPSCTERVFAGMTEDQRIGQLFHMGLAKDQLGAAEISEIQSDHVGSVWFVDTTTAGAAAVRYVTTAVQAQVNGQSTAGVRFFIAANQEGGVIQAMRGSGFSTIPSALTQGGWSSTTLQDQATTWGRQLLAAGINMNFAPVMDVVPPGFDAQNQPIGALQREFGHDPTTNGTHGAAFVRGMHQAGVAVTLKHFPGLGRVAGNTDYIPATDTVTTINDPYLQSFKQGIDAGPDAVMVAIATFTQIDPSRVAAFSPTVIGQLLRTNLGFQGVVISDDLGATGAVASIPAGTRALEFLSAGGNFIISKTAVASHAMVLAVRAKAASDASFRGLVDDSAMRILRLKQAWGLLPC